MNREELVKQIKEKRSFLCVGLDSDIKKLPACLQNSEDAIFDFNKAIIDATADLCVAYKPNLAFYESIGIEGWNILERTVEYIREKYPNQFQSADHSKPQIPHFEEHTNYHIYIEKLPPGSTPQIHGQSLLE